MFQVRKSCFCGISAIFCWYCFMSETQVLMTVSDFFGFFLGIIFMNGASFFGGEHLMGASALMGGGSLKKSWNWVYLHASPIENPV